MKTTNRRFRLHPFLPSGILLLALATAAFAAAPGFRDTVKIVHKSRPLAALANELEKRLGVVITYEDPAWVHAGDLSDVTLEVAPKGAARKKGAPPLLIPLRRDLEVTLPPAAAGKALDPAGVVQAAIDAHQAARNPGRFRVVQEGADLHIVPGQLKDSSGKWMAAEPILDTKIDLPSAERTRIETIQALVAAINGASKTQVRLGMLAMPGKQDRLTLGASGEPARQILEKALAGLAPKASWRLLYDRTTDQYLLNLHYIPELPRL